MQLSAISFHSFQLSFISAYVDYTGGPCITINAAVLSSVLQTRVITADYLIK